MIFSRQGLGSFRSQGCPLEVQEPKRAIPWSQAL